MIKLNVLDLFSGVGGLSYGFYKSPHFKIIAANEILNDMAIAYTLNHPDVLMFHKDICKLNTSDFNNLPKIDIIIGGPPCQAYSTVGKRLLDDPRGKLFQEYFRILKIIKPKTFLFENVKGLMSINQGKLLTEIIDLFSSLGYFITYKVLDAADFGVPQNRKRVIIVGTLVNKKYKYPNPTHINKQNNLFDRNLKSHVSLIEAIGDLPSICSGEASEIYDSPPLNEYQSLMRDASSRLLDHNATTHNEKLIEIMSHIPEGGGLKDVPISIRPKKAFGNSYSRLWKDKPSTTITRNFGTPSSARCIHPLINRGLTTREGARLQSFPDNYLFYGSRSSKNLQIGNAVPPLLSNILASSIIALHE